MIDDDRQRLINLLTDYGSTLLIAYHEFKEFRDQVDRIIEDSSAKLTINGFGNDTTQLMLSIALWDSTKEWYANYKKIEELEAESDDQ